VFGPESLEYLIAIKGLPQSDPHDVRYIKAFALGIAVASRGADHLRNRPTLEILELPEDVTEKEAEAFRRKMIREKGSRTSAPISSKRVTGRMVLAAYRIHLELKSKMS